MKPFNQIAEEIGFVLTEASNVSALKRDMEYAYIAFTKTLYALEAEAKAPEVKTLLSLATDQLHDAVVAVKKKVK